MSETRRSDLLSARRSALVTIAVGAVLLGLSGMAAEAALTDLEVEAFRTFNDLPQAVYPVIWPAMQYGTFITIPALALIALVLRRRRLAIALLLSGVGVYVFAKLVKEIVGRGRPEDLLVGVQGRETFGEGSLGFPSGHAAVAAALTVVVWRHLGRRWRIAALVIALVVFLGRMYVGAHLPLDLVGGAALGVIAGGLANLLVAPDPQ